MRATSQADEQLSFELCWLSEADFLAAMRRRGADELVRVRFRPNRTRLVSLSADRTSLNVHSAFRSAPGDVLDAIAVFATAARAGTGYRRAIRRLRHWWERQTEDGVAEEPAARAECCGTPAQRAFLAGAFAQLNRRHFGGALPADIPLRLSARMSRRFGHIHYGRSRTDRTIDEIALNVNLMLPGNESHFVDTLLHEMAHAEAWLQHAHRGHGRLWRRIAERVGARPRACSDVRLRRRRNGVVTTVPDLQLV